MSADGAGGDGGPKQRFELYIKASAIDKETKGSCPICQHWFMITCLLGENQDDIDFKVYTVQADCPPKNFGVDQGWSKKFPVVMVLEGRDKRGQDLAGTKYDTFEELEVFFEAINKECRQLKRKNAPNVAAMKAVESVYNAFNTSLSSGQPNKKLLSELKKINTFLEEDYSEAIYLVDNVLSFSDCYLLPRLQHIRVAGKEYLNFDIPADCQAIWRYLANAYQTEAFRSTMPSDQDIVFHYEKKASSALAHMKRRPRPTLQHFTYTMDIPEDIAALLQETADPGTGANGDVREEESQPPVQQMSAVDIAPQEVQQMSAVDITSQEVQRQEEGVHDGDDFDNGETLVAPPPPVVADDDDGVEQAALLEAAPSAEDEVPSCQVPEESAYESVAADDVITADQAVAVNSSPSPPSPPAVDYEVGGGEAAADGDPTLDGDEHNYVNVDVHEGGDDDGGARKDLATVEICEDEGVKVTASQEEEGEGVGEVRKEVGNGDVLKKEDGVDKAEDDRVAAGAE